MRFVQHLRQTVQQIDLAERAAFFAEQGAGFKPIDHVEPDLFKLGWQRAKQGSLVASGLTKSGHRQRIAAQSSQGFAQRLK